MFTGWCARCCGGRNPSHRPVEQTFFYRLAKFAMRRAIPIGLAGAALLVALGLPFSHCQVGPARRSRITDVELGAPGRRSAAHRFR